MQANAHQTGERDGKRGAITGVTAALLGIAWKRVGEPGRYEAANGPAKAKCGDQDRADQRTTQAGDGVQQGYLEGSNVDSLQELVQMITVERSFTATQKALTGIGRLQENLITNILR